MKVFRQIFTTKVTWDDVIDKLEHDYKLGSYGKGGSGEEITPPSRFQAAGIVIDELHEYPPTFLLRGNYFPGSLQHAYNEVKQKWGAQKDGPCYSDLHVYVSFGAKSKTFGRHRDAGDDFIVQVIGSIQYKFDNGETAILNPGDGIFIAKGEYHDPVVSCARVTLSASPRKRLNSKGFIFK